MTKSYKIMEVLFPRFFSKSSSEFSICWTFKNSSSSSFCYTFTSHACNLGSHTTFFLSFNSFQVTIQHATIVVHENCWDNFKKLPQTSLLLCDTQVAHESSQKLFLPCRIWMAKCQNFSDMRYKTSKAFATHV